MAIAAVEMAAWAIYAEKKRVSLSQLIGGVKSTIESGVSIGIQESPEALIDAIQKINSNRFAPATAILMHPRRWAFLSAGVDGQNRPLVLPAGNQPKNTYGVGEAADYG